MRCASVTTIYAFTGTGTTRGTYTGLTVGPEGVTTCTAAQYVVLTNQEFQRSVSSPFHLTLAEGGAISGAILLVWAAGWGIRQLTRALRTPEPEVQNYD
jgi:hypothetical protein